MNSTLCALGGPCIRYCATSVAWNDGQRGVVNGVLSCAGKNITDARIVAESPRKIIPFVRPHNLDEALGVTTADKLWMFDKELVSVQSVLETLESRAAYRGFSAVEPNVTSEHPIVVRVQTAWIPLEEGETNVKCAPGNFSYQTSTETDPRNLIVVGTAEGIFVHHDRPGVNKLLGHKLADDGTVEEHWFVATESDHCVGRSHIGDSTAVELGLKGMGPRCNCFMVLSLPNSQKADDYVPWYPSDDDDDQPIYRSLSSTAARMTVDNEVYGNARDANMISIKRPEDEPIVVTILLFNVLKPGHTIQATDLAAAVTDMEAIYDLCDARCKMSELPAMLHQWKTEDVNALLRNKRARRCDFVPSKTALATAKI